MPRPAAAAAAALSQSVKLAERALETETNNVLNFVKKRTKKNINTLANMDASGQVTMRSCGKLKNIQNDKYSKIN